MRKRIAFKPHETRGQEIIKIIETNRGNCIANDWDYCGLIMKGWEIYTLEEFEKKNRNLRVS